MASQQAFQQNSYPNIHTKFQVLGSLQTSLIENTYKYCKKIKVPQTLI